MIQRIVALAGLSLGLFASSAHADSERVAAERSPAALSARIAKGPYLTSVTATAAEVRLELVQDAPMSLEVRKFGSSAVGSGNVYSAPSAAIFDDAAHQGPRVLRVAGLTPKTRYEYRVLVGKSAAAAIAKGEFTTAPDDDTPFTFLTYGDNRSDDDAHRAVVHVLSTAPGDFFVHTGDFVAVGGNDDAWQNFFSIEGELLRSRAIFTTVGNHELIENGGGRYLQYFGSSTYPYAKPGALLPILSATSRWGNTRFFYLNSMTEWGAGPEREWLDRELAKAEHEAGLAWRIVVTHSGLFSSGPHGANPEMTRAALADYFREKGIDLMLTGHDHIYERGFGGGLRYVVTGGGGAPLYNLGPALPSTRKAESVRHYVQIAVTPSRIVTTAKRLDGSIIETCSFAKGIPDWECDAASRTARSAKPTPAKPRGCACVMHENADNATVGSGLFGLLAVAAICRARLRGSRHHRP